MIPKVLTVEEWIDEHRYGMTRRFRKSFSEYSCPVCQKTHRKYLVAQDGLSVCPTCEVVEYDKEGVIQTSKSLIPFLENAWKESGGCWVDFMHIVTFFRKTKQQEQS